MKILCKTNARNSARHCISIARLLFFVGGLALGLLLPTLPLEAQQVNRHITGQVVATDGLPVVGATVVIKGTNIGVSTDSSGKFSIMVPLSESKEAPVLQISHLGMLDQEVKCTKDNFYKIQMEDLLEAIQGVVVVSTGYQRVDKRILSSSVTSIKGDAVVESNSLSLDNMLQGKVAGLQVLNSSSTPGAAPKIRIRGTSTISGSREPLWVVDGVILDDPVSISTEELNNLDNVNLIGNAISGLNPMDIERIDVLKDASATAIYGVRAANGVIVVTTKKGKKGQPVVSYSGTVTVTSRPSYRQLHLMNSQERIEVSKEIEERGLNYNFAPAAVGYEGLLYDLYDRKIDYEQFLSKVQILETTNTDWFDLLYRNSVSHKHNISISGGSDRVNYYFSGAYTDDRANVKGTGVTQYNATMKLQAELRHNLTATVQLRANISDKDYLHSSISPYEYAYNTSRAIPAFNEDGSYAYYNRTTAYGSTPLVFNILNEIDNSGRNIHGSGIYFNTNLEWRILPALRATGTFALNSAHTTDKEWFTERSYAAAQLRQLNYGETFPDVGTWKTDYCALPYGGELKNSDSRNFAYTARAQIDYSKTFKQVHSISAAAGFEARSVQYDGLASTQWGYMPDRGETFVAIDPAEWPEYKNMVLGTPNVVTNRLSNFLSWFSVLTYSYDMRYILNANIRADGSNKFGQDKSTRFLPIWSVSARWNAHNESFLQNALWINELAIRGSLGVQGNVSDDQTPNTIVQIGSLDTFSGEYLSTLSKLPNPFLRWEKTTSYDIALDFALFNNRLNGSVEYYYKKGRDQIVTTNVSPTTGATSMSMNRGDLVNKGYELIITGVPVRTKDFSWSLSFNGSKNINKVTWSGIDNYNYQQYIDGSAILNGYPINSFFSYRFDKLDENGLPLFFGIDEQEGESKESKFARAFVLSGNRVPDIQGGFSTLFTYKNWSLNLMFAYSVGSKLRMNYLYDNVGQQLPNPQQNMSDEFVHRWRHPGDNTNIPALSTEALNLYSWSGATEYPIGDNRWQMYNESDLRVVSGDYLRLRTAYLRYTLPENFCQKLHLKSANIRLEGNNLWLIASKKLLGQDPEQLSFNGTTASTPPIASFSMGIDITF